MTAQIKESSNIYYSGFEELEDFEDIDEVEDLEDIKIRRIAELDPEILAIIQAKGLVCKILTGWCLVELMVSMMLPLFLDGCALP